GIALLAVRVVLVPERLERLAAAASDQLLGPIDVVPAFEPLANAGIRFEQRPGVVLVLLALGAEPQELATRPRVAADAFESTDPSVVVEVPSSFHACTDAGGAGGLTEIVASPLGRRRPATS